MSRPLEIAREREEQIKRLLKQKLTKTVIAQRLGMSEQGVRIAVRRMKERGDVL